ncbi:MAG: DUF1080 domain-containing protein [Maribacter sp.]
MIFKQSVILGITLVVCNFSNGQDEASAALDDVNVPNYSTKSIDISKKWTNLLNEDHANYWEVFIGVPHGTVTDLAGIDPESDGKKGVPLGLNNDPKKVFKIEQKAGETILHISGEIYGALTSKETYENYHLKLEFKWGDKIWEPRLNRERDNGLLYHCIGEHGAFWNVWMQSQEFQVQQGYMGDYYAIAKTSIDIPSTKKEGDKEFNYVEGGPLNHFSSAEPGVPGHANKGFDNENPHGEWNTLELITLGDTSLHIVNGKVVMALYNSKYQDSHKKMLPLTKGKIQIQSEAAEAYYKNIQVKQITEIPNKFKRQL